MKGKSPEEIKAAQARFEAFKKKLLLENNKKNIHPHNPIYIGDHKIDEGEVSVDFSETESLESLDLDEIKKYHKNRKKSQGKIPKKILPDDSDIFSENESESQLIANINPDDKLSDVSISDEKPNYDIKPDNQLSDLGDISASNILDTDKSLDKTLDTTIEEDQQQTPDDKINFKTKPSLKELPGIGQKASGFWPGVKRGAMGGLRILLIPAATSIIFGCGLFVVLAFLFKVPAAAILEKIGFKETAKDLISGKEVELAQKVALTVFDFVYGGTARDFGAHGRGLNELARTAIETVSSENTINTQESSDIKQKENNKGNKEKPKSSPSPISGYNLLEYGDEIISKISRIWR
jgi:hypothetical protein